MEGLKELDFKRGQGVLDGELSDKQRAALFNTMILTVVKVEVYREKLNRFALEGTGVFVSSEGYLLTTSGVINNDIEAKVRVVTIDGVIYLCHVVNLDESLGLAILQAENADENKKFPYAKIYAGKIGILEMIYPIGHPLHLDFSCSVAHVGNPCCTYEEVLNGVRSGRIPKREMNKYDHDKYELNNSMSLVLVNNVEGDEGIRGMPFFNYRGHILGLYIFTDGASFGIHAKSLRSYISTHLGV